MTLEIAVLVSVGRHPVSGRARRAPRDAQALELGLRLAAMGSANLWVLHAGSAREEPALRDYLGMGLETLSVLALPPGADPLPPLRERLGAIRPALILAGTQAEAGWSSGYLPYALAAALDYAIVPAAAELVLSGGTADILQALPQGRRRAVRVTLPAIITVDAAAPPARQPAYGRAHRGHVLLEQPSVRPAPPPEYGEARPARVRPRRLRIARGATAADRFQALTSGPARAARIVHPASATAAAREIHALLLERGLIEPGRGAAGQPPRGVGTVT